MSGWHFCHLSRPLNHVLTAMQPEAGPRSNMLRHWYLTIWPFSYERFVQKILTYYKFLCRGYPLFVQGKQLLHIKHTDVHIQHMEWDMTGYILIYLLRSALHSLRLFSVANTAIASTGNQTLDSCRSGRIISICSLCEILVFLQGPCRRESRLMGSLFFHFDTCCPLKSAGINSSTTQIPVRSLLL